MCKECGCGNRGSEGTISGRDSAPRHVMHAAGDAAAVVGVADKGADASDGEMIAKTRTIEMNESVTRANDALAGNTSHGLTHMGVLCINVMGSPGSGKTSLIENISKFISPSCMAVIQGDLESDIDKVRLMKRNIQTHQINTHSGCHLTAAMIDDAMKHTDFRGKRFLFIENVGNLVCPAGVKLGQHVNMVVSSVSEGADKPKKYPYIFMDADIVVITKTDLAHAVDFDEEAYLRDIANINGHTLLLKTSTKMPDSFQGVAHFLEHEREHLVGHEHSHEHAHEHIHDDADGNMNDHAHDHGHDHGHDHSDD